jgi:hypothetical protein
MAAVAMMVGGRIEIITLRPVREYFEPGTAVKYVSHRSRCLRNATVVTSNERGHWLKRRKQREIFVRLPWEVFEKK